MQLALLVVIICSLARPVPAKEPAEMVVGDAKVFCTDPALKPMLKVPKAVDKVLATLQNGLGQVNLPTAAAAAKVIGEVRPIVKDIMDTFIIMFLEVDLESAMQGHEDAVAVLQKVIKLPLDADDEVQPHLVTAVESFFEIHTQALHISDEWKNKNALQKIWDKNGIYVKVNSLKNKYQAWLPVLQILLAVESRFAIERSKHELEKLRRNIANSITEAEKSRRDIANGISKAEKSRRDIAAGLVNSTDESLRAIAAGLVNTTDESLRAIRKKLEEKDNSADDAFDDLFSKMIDLSTAMKSNRNGLQDWVEEQRSQNFLVTVLLVIIFVLVAIILGLLAWLSFTRIDRLEQQAYRTLQAVSPEEGGLKKGGTTDGVKKG